MNEIVPANGALMSFIERAAKDPEFDVGKFGELLRLQRDVGHDQSRRAFNGAMAMAQSEMLPVVRDARNSHLNNRYAKLETIDAAMRPIYTRHGFSVRFGSAPPPAEGFIRITCTVAHEGGYFEENYLDSPITTTGSQGGRMATTPVQAVGSTVTYLRRYLLGMVFNIVLADEDDDGEGSRRVAATATPRAPVKRAPVDAEDAYQAPPPHPARRTAGQLLDGIEIALRDATSRVEVDRILDVEEVFKFREHFAADSPPILRLNALRDAALARHPPSKPREDEPTAEEPDPDLEIVGEKYAAG
jgi:hypothetical protein